MSKDNFQVLGQAFQLEENLHSVNMLLLNQSNLNKDPIFKSLKTDLENHYNQVKKSAQKPSAEKRSSLPNSLYRNLHSLLSEVTYTNDAKIQKATLQNIHNWYSKKRNLQNKLPEIDHLNNLSYKEYQPTEQEVNQNSSFSPFFSISSNQNSRSLSPYVPKSFTPADSLLENFKTKYIQRRAIKHATSKENHQRHQVLLEWGSKKSRNNEEFGRKFDQKSLRKAFKISESLGIKNVRSMKYTKTPMMHDFTEKNELLPKNLESDYVRPSILSNIRKAHGFLIDFDSHPKNTEKKAHESNISNYMHNIIKNDYYPSRANSSERFNDQHQEVNLVKQKLATKSIVCSIETLMNGLILPNDEQKIIINQALPRGGEYLINSPLKIIKKVAKKKTRKKTNKKN